MSLVASNTSSVQKAHLFPYATPHQYHHTQSPLSLFLPAILLIHHRPLTISSRWAIIPFSGTIIALSSSETIVVVGSTPRRTSSGIGSIIDSSFSDTTAGTSSATSALVQYAGGVQVAQGRISKVLVSFYV